MATYTEYLDFDTFGIHTHSSGDSHFDSTAVRDTILDLACDAGSYKWRIKFWSFNLKDINLNIFLVQFF